MVRKDPKVLTRPKMLPEWDLARWLGKAKTLRAPSELWKDAEIRRRSQ